MRWFVGPDGKVNDSGIGDMGPTRAGKFAFFARNGGAKPAKARRKGEVIGVIKRLILVWGGVREHFRAFACHPNRPRRAIEPLSDK